jgi:hypothetical protein
MLKLLCAVDVDGLMNAPPAPCSRVAVYLKFESAPT